MQQDDGIRHSGAGSHHDACNARGRPDFDADIVCHRRPKNSNTGSSDCPFHEVPSPYGECDADLSAPGTDRHPLGFSHDTFANQSAFAHCYGYMVPDGVADSHPYTDSIANGVADSHPYTDSIANGDDAAHCHSTPVARPNCVSFPDRNSCTDADCDANCYAFANSDSHPDHNAHADPDSHGNPCSYSYSYSVPSTCPYRRAHADPDAHAHAGPSEGSQVRHHYGRFLALLPPEYARHRLVYRLQRRPAYRAPWQDKGPLHTPLARS